MSSAGKEFGNGSARATVRNEHGESVTVAVDTRPPEDGHCGSITIQIQRGDDANLIALTYAEGAELRGQLVSLGPVGPRTACDKAGAEVVAEKLRVIASVMGGGDTSDGIFLMSLSDAVQHGDAMPELGGKTLAIVRLGGV